MAVFLPHMLTVTERIYPPEAAGEEALVERDYELACPGVTDRCRGYFECLEKDCDKEALAAADLVGGPPIQHGKVHKYIDLGWCTVSDQCLYVGNDRMPDAAEALDRPAGVYPVDVDYRGDYEIDLIALDPQPAVI